MTISGLEEALEEYSTLGHGVEGAQLPYPSAQAMPIERELSVPVEDNKKVHRER